MKKLELFVMLLLVMNSIFAQSESSKLSYQAVVRNSSNELVTNQNVQVAITILDAANVSQYGETHAVMTNQNGLLSIMIGEGSSKTGDFSQIVWKDAVIRSVITLPGGATVTQNTPVTAMPYALYAESLNESALAQYLSDNHYVTESQLPVIPAQVNADWNATEGVTMILNKPEIPTLPTLATVATTGSYNDLSDLPSIPTVPNNVSGFNNDAQYVNNASCDTISFCELVATIQTLKATISDLQNQVDELGGGSAMPCPETPTITDYDGNVYNTIMLGTQCWMKENLRTKHYSDGTEIAARGTAYTTGTIPAAYCIWVKPGEGTAINNAYGRLYNYTAIMHGASSSATNPSSIQGVCPTGWHIPSDAEWGQLENYLISQNKYLCDDDATHHYYGKALASKSGWETSTSYCSIGNFPSDNNGSGFSAMPSGSAGCSSSDGRSINLSSTSGYANFWSATQDKITESKVRYFSLPYNGYKLNAMYTSSSDYYQWKAFSVRCVKD